MDFEQAVREGLNFCVSAYPRQVQWIPLNTEQYRPDWIRAINGYTPETVKAAFLEHCQISDKWPTFADIVSILKRPQEKVPKPKTEMEAKPFQDNPAPRAVEFCRLVIALLDYRMQSEKEPKQGSVNWQKEILEKRDQIGLAYEALRKDSPLEQSRWNAYFSRLVATGEIPSAPHPQVVRGTLHRGERMEPYDYEVTTDGQGRDTVKFPGRVFSWQTL